MSLFDLQFSFGRALGALLSKVLTVALLFLLVCRAEAQRCETIFVTPVRSAWQNPSVAIERLNTVIAAENIYRESKGLPGIALSLKASDYSSPVIIPGESHRYWIATKGFPDEPILGQFHIEGDSVVRRVINDIYSMNFAYTFSERAALTKTPYSIWTLNRSLDKSISLYRKMSHEEFQLWQKGEIDKLGSNWGHTSASGQPLRVSHFSTSSKWTTSAESDLAPIIKVVIDKAHLISWAKETNQLWAASLNDDASVLEYVVPVNLLERLHTDGVLRFELLNSGGVGP